jgi:hypothetical protein
MIMDCLPVFRIRIHLNSDPDAGFAVPGFNPDRDPDHDFTLYNKKNLQKITVKPVLWIRDILVRIRIGTQGFVPMTFFVSG